MDQLNIISQARAKRQQERAADGAVEQIADGVPSVDRPDRPERNGGMPSAFDTYVLWWRQYRRPAVSFAVALLAAVVVGAVVLRPTYTSSTLLAISEDELRNEWDLLKSESNQVDLEEQIRSRAVLEPALRELGWIKPERASSRRSARQAAAAARRQRQALGRRIDGFRQTVGVGRLRHSNILRVTVEDHTPERASDAANMVAKSFIDHRRQKAIENAERLIAALDEEMATIRNELDTLTILRAQVSVDDTALQELGKQLAMADTRLSQARSRYTESNPIVIQARREKEAMERILQEQGRRLKSKLRPPAMSDKPIMEMTPQAGTVEAAMSHAQRRYQELLDRRSQSRFLITLWKQPGQSFQNIAVLDEALPPPSRPWFPRLLASAFAGALVSVLSLFLVPVVLRAWQARPAKAWRAKADVLLARLPAQLRHIHWRWPWRAPASAREDAQDRASVESAEATV